MLGATEAGTHGAAVFQQDGKGSQQYDYLGKSIAPYEDSTKCTSIGKMLEIHKICWLPVGLAGCAYQHFTFGDVTIRMLLMTALFGAYGLVWALKSNIYPDLFFYNADEAKITGVGNWIFSFLMIAPYFLFPITAAFNPTDMDHWQVVVCPLLFCLGGFFHWAGDAQRYFQLKYAAGKLVTNNFYAHMRHPSYTGELLIWIGLTLMNPWFWYGVSLFPLVYLLVIIFLKQIPGKEQRLSRYPEWEQYKAQTPMIWPNPISFGRLHPQQPTTELLYAGA